MSDRQDVEKNCSLEKSLPFLSIYFLRKIVPENHNWSHVLKFKSESLLYTSFLSQPKIFLNWFAPPSCFFIALLSWLYHKTIALRAIWGHKSQEPVMQVCIHFLTPQFTHTQPIFLNIWLFNLQSNTSRVSKLIVSQINPFHQGIA